MKTKRECTTKTKTPYYRIGVFAQMNKTTIKTLRHYDETGLLKPAYVDDQTGYRYYQSSQLPTLHKILALRELDCSLEEIKHVLEGSSEHMLLGMKKRQLLQEIANMTKQIVCIESYLAQDNEDQPYHVIIKGLPEVIVATKEVQLEGYDELFEYMPDMGVEMEQAGCECIEPGYCFTMYTDQEYRDSNINAIICEAVTEAKEDQEHVKFLTLPEVEMAACVLHKGPYEKLPMTYQAIVTFIEENGYEIIGLQREAYIDGIWNKEAEEDWLTEVQFPVKKIEAM